MKRQELFPSSTPDQQTKASDSASPPLKLPVASDGGLDSQKDSTTTGLVVQVDGETPRSAKKKKKKPASGRSTPSNKKTPTPAAAPVEGNTLHAMPHPQLDDDFEQNLRGIDELGDGDDFDFDALLGENIF